MKELLEATALEQARAIRGGEVSSTELVEAALTEAIRVQDELGAFTLLDGERALVAAAGVAAGDERPFAGVPYAPKDLGMACTGFPLTNGSRLFGDFSPGYDAVAVARARAAGMVIIGQTVSAELGMLPVTDTIRYGSARNPFDPDRTAGGSSGGAAAAVGGGALAIAGASDAGGSIRIPAACCGLVGLKPSRGRVSMAPDMGDHTLAVEGCVSRDVADTAAFLDVVAGPAPSDPIHLAPPPRPFAELATERERRRIGLSVEPLFAGEVDPERVAAAERVASVLEGLGHEVVRIEGNPWAADEVANAFVDLFSVGVAGFAALGEMVSGQEAGPDTLEPLTVHIVERGRTLPAIAVAGAQQALHLWTSAVAAAIGEFDAVLSPILTEKPLPVGTIADLASDPQAAIDRALAFTGFATIANVTGRPALSLPAGRDAEGLPVNVQLLGRQADEGTLLALGAELEGALAGG
jgi:amidase